MASWSEAHAAYGRLPLARCLESAIGYARDGFPVTERMANWREVARSELEKCPHASAIFLKDGRVLRGKETDRLIRDELAALQAAFPAETARRPAASA